jgi:ADP-dependent glucokinase
MISSLADFADSFAYWFEKGAAAERFVETAELFEEIVTLAQTLSQRVEYKTGGNAALMATALGGESCECDVLLGGLVGPQLRGLLSPTIRTVAPPPSSSSPDSDTEGDSEDGSEGGVDAIHLIMEYSRDETWGEITSPRHNRFIVVHDAYNANIEGLESLSQQVEAEGAVASFGVFIASGLNQLEGLDPETRDARLSAVASHLRALDAATPVHLELASMVHRDFLLHMFSSLAVHSDSVGLNEEELAMLYEVLGGGYTGDSFTQDMLTGRVPDPRAVGLALQYVLDAVDLLHAAEPSSPPTLRQVSRMHFHCLSFHIIAVREEVTVQHWTNRMDAAVSRGAIAAVSKACALPLDELTDSHIDVLAPMSFTTPSGEVLHITETSPVAVWSSGGHSFYVAPVPVCKQPKNTVGLGDAISANALAYSLL